MKRFPLLPRKANTSKNDYGHTLVVAGSRDMAGAVILTARAALISGSGLVTLAAPSAIRPMLFKLLPESQFLEMSFVSIERYIFKRNITTLAIGPGLSTKPLVASLVRKLIGRVRIPIVLDADGLNAFQGHAALLKRHRGPLVMTPHAGEFKRLFGDASAKEISKKYNAVLVMKGHRTEVFQPGSVYVNRSGNPGLAKGGSGDVLTGIIAAFISQGLPPYEAAKWAVYCHGLAGDKVAREKSQLSVTASDLIRALPAIYRQCSK